MDTRITETILPALKETGPNCLQHFDQLTLVCSHDGTVLIDEPAPGARIAGAYEYVSMLGTGGMGIVFKARHQILNVDVAIKMLLHQSPTEIRRFQQEAKAASMLQHENIVFVRDFGVTDDGFPFMVMEYLNGENLTSIIERRGALPVNETVNIFRAVCRGMAFAHENGVIHRDLKPSNIVLVRQKDGSLLPKVVDFGIAKIMAGFGNKTNAMTQTGEIFGSPLYMSPEQALGQTVDYKTDIYSAGCVLFHALTASPPFQGKTAIETMIKHIQERAPKLKDICPDKYFSPALETVVAGALAKDPAQRFSSFKEFEKALTLALQPNADRTVNREAKAERASATRLIYTRALALCLVLLAVYCIFNRCLIQAQAVGSSGQEHSTSARHPVALGQVKENGSAGDELQGILNTSEDDLVRGLIDLIRPNKDGVDVELSEPYTTDKSIAYLVGKAKPELKKSRLVVTTLNIARSHVSNEGIKLLPHLPLRSLNIGKAAVTGECLHSVGSISSLEELSAESLKQTTRQDLSHLTRLSHLRWLSLAYADISDGDLAFLPKLANTLTYLDLRLCPLTDRAMLYVGKLTHLSDLSLQGSRVGDRGIEELRGLKSLRKVTLNFCPVSNNALRILSGCALWKLDICGTYIDDEGLKLLENQRDLEELKVQSCKRITIGAIKRLQGKLPNCNIIF